MGAPLPGRLGEPSPLAPASAGILLTLGFSTRTHPLLSQRKKRQNILAAQANGSQMTEVKKHKTKPRSSVICFFLKAKTNRIFLCSGFSLFSLSCLSCCLHFHSSQWKM